MTAGPTPLHRSLAIQARVILALLIREVLTRFGRHNIGFLWLFVEPMLFTLAITAFWTVARGSVLSGLPIVAFAVTGYSSVLLWRNMPSRCCNAIEPNLSLMYHRHVKVIDIFSARILLEAIGATTSFVTLMLAFGAIGWMRAPEDVLKDLKRLETLWPQPLADKMLVYGGASATMRSGVRIVPLKGFAAALGELEAGIES